jgi:TPR repeat protein
MRQSLFLVALLAGFATASPATARDNFRTGSTAYAVGLYGSAARHWLTLAEKGHPPAQYNVGCPITDRACAATGSKPINGS